MSSHLISSQCAVALKNNTKRFKYGLNSVLQNVVDWGLRMLGKTLETRHSQHDTTEKNTTVREV